MIYSFEKNEWIDPEISHHNPKWNLSGIMAPSIPSWKYFIFGGSIGAFQEGGNRTTSRFVDEVFYLEVDNLEWHEVILDESGEEDYNNELIEYTPKARESPAVVYD